jgi:polyisoprenoid-binding protein YceI
MKKIIVFILGSALSFPVLSADIYTVDSRHTFPSFRVDHMGFSIQKGRFNHTAGKISLSPEKNTGHIEVVIDADSIDTGLVELEEHLKKPDFLEIERYPKITFVSTSLQFVKDVLVAVEGNLTLHGVTRPVHLDVKRFKCGLNPIALKQVCGADVITSFKRSDFGVSKYVPMISDDVQVEIQIEAIKD